MWKASLFLPRLVFQWLACFSYNNDLRLCCICGDRLKLWPHCGLLSALNIQKAKIMASIPITSWQIDGETMETAINLIFLGSKITTDSDCSHEIKRCLLLERKAMTNLDIKKQRHYFADKGLSSQSYGFSSSHVWMCELDIKKKKLITKELMPLNCDVGEDYCKSLGLQRNPTSQSWRKSTLNIHWKDWCLSSSNLTTWCKEPTHWQRNPAAGKD